MGAILSQAPLCAGWACSWLERSAKSAAKFPMRRPNSLDRCDFGVKMAAFAALGEMAALREDGVNEPLVLAWSGVKEGESTLNFFFEFSFRLALDGSWM